jgi:hypothetical protein
MIASVVTTSAEALVDTDHWELNVMAEYYNKDFASLSMDFDL